jgi:cell fate regulator YaaT (PSP1 superfamily)
MRMLCVLESKQTFAYGQRVLCRTQRGTEFGEVLCEANETVLKQLENPPDGTIIRRASSEDEQANTDLGQRGKKDFDTCERTVGELGLQMEIVDVERIFGGERVVIYYLAEQRVDFRQLVRQLATELQTRVEMRQIGVRDEAKLLADYGDCGKPVCCNTHLSKMPPVSMKMAKLQKATLDPSKISGRCGRLKCCLRYEYDTYEELRRELPSPGSQIVTASGRATVLNQEILSQQLLIQTEDNRRILISAADVLSVIKRSAGKPVTDDRVAEPDTSENGT